MTTAAKLIEELIEGSASGEILSALKKMLPKPLQGTVSLAYKSPKGELDFGMTDASVKKYFSGAKLDALGKKYGFSKVSMDPSGKWTTADPGTLSFNK